MEIFNFPENLMKLSMCEQCVPGSLSPPTHGSLEIVHDQSVVHCSTVVLDSTQRVSF